VGGGGGGGVVVEVDFSVLVSGVSVLLIELVELDLIVASDPPTPPPAALPTTMMAATTPIQNVFFRRPHIVRAVGSSCTDVIF